MEKFKKISATLFFILSSLALSTSIKAQPPPPLPDGTTPLTTISFEGPFYQFDDKIFISSRSYVVLTSTDPEIPGEIQSGVEGIYYAVTPFEELPPETSDQYTLYKDSFTLFESSHTIHYFAIDNAGNTEIIHSSNVYVDGTGPVTALTMNSNPVLPDTTLYMPVEGQLELWASDYKSHDVASGFKDIFYLINLSMPLQECFAVEYDTQSPPGTCTNPIYTGPFTLAFGTYTLHYGSIDNVDNMGPFDFVNVDVGSAPVSISQISVTAIGISSITWTWDIVENAVGYHVYFADGSSVTVTNTEYVLQGLFPNTQHNICVSAYNLYGESLPTCGSTVFTFAVVPGKPYFTSVSSHSFYAEWNALGNSPGTGYQVGISTDNFKLNFSTPITVLHNLTSTNVFICDLFPDTTYSVRVQAYNGDGILTDFSEISSTKTLPAPPLPPDITAPVTEIYFYPPAYTSPENKLFISSVTDILFNARDPEIPDSIVSGTATINYWIDSDISTTSPSIYSAPFQILEGTHTIYYQSIDHANNYEEIKSTYVYVDGTPPITSINMEPSPVVKDTTYYVLAGSTFTLSADDPILNNVSSGRKDIFYIIDLNVSTETCFNTPYVSNASSGTCENPFYSGGFSLPVGTHTIHYFAIDNVGNQEIINFIFTEIGNPPSQVAGISGYALGISSIMWSWNSIENADGYRIYSDTGAVLGSVTTNYYILEGLTPNINRYICVSAYNLYGESLPACASKIYTLAVVPGKPYFTQVSSYSFSLNWNDSQNPYPTGYQVSISTDDFFLNFSTPVPVTANYFEKYATIQGLTPDTTYYTRVQAYNGDKILTDFSEISSSKTLLAPPQPPENVTAIFSTATKNITISWSAAISGSPAVSFNVDRAKEPSPNSFTQIVSGTTDFTYADYIIQTSTYYYRVTGLNADGLESEPSAIVSILADVQPPGGVTDFKVISTDSATLKVTLSWTAPSEDVKLAKYIIKGMERWWVSTEWDSAQFFAEVLASTPSGGKETFVLSLVSTNVVYLALKAVDSFGYESSISNMAIADFEPPSLVVISTVTPNSIVGRPFTTRITAQDNYRLSDVEYLVDGNVLISWSHNSQSLDEFYTWDTLELSDGYHVFSVRVADFSSNKAQWNLPLIINYVPPLAPVITDPKDETKISTTTVIVVGTSEPNMYISIFVNDTFVASGQSNINGDFYITNVPFPGDGVFSITAQAVDKKGSSPRSKPVSVIVDLGPPNPPQNLSAGSAKDGRVKLLWSLPDGEKPVSYNIYRSTSETGLVAGTSPYQSFLIGQGITVLEYSDLPPSDSIYYYYGVTSVDGAKNESLLSNISVAVSDRFGPSASITLSSAPPLGAGNYLVTITVSETLSFAPYLTFTPYGMSPIQINLVPVTALVWTGTITVTADMTSGTGKFSFSGTDLSGNTGFTITSGSTLEIETQGPEAVLSIDTNKLVLKDGDYAITLNLNEPARESPFLSYTTQSGSTTTILLSSSTSTSAWAGLISIDTTTGEGFHNFIYFAYDTLGNKGELLSGTTYFIVDTIAPSNPISLNALTGAGGTVNLIWSAPSGEEPSAYCLYSDVEKITCDIIPKIEDLTGFYQDKPLEGSYTYTVTALDIAGNESPSISTNVITDSTPPQPPLITSFSTLDVYVELTWSPQGVEIPVKYKLYRSTYSLITTSGLSYRVIFGTTIQDSPESDGIYYYYITALDKAGNESGLSNEAQVTYDGAAPVITISGIENNAYYNLSVLPVINIMDLSLAVSTITLNNSPFVSGSTISAEGTYTLAVSAQDISGRSSAKSLSWTIDKTIPAISFSGVQNNGYYEQSIAPVISASDINFSTLTTLLNNEPWVSGSSITAGGSYVLKIDAADKAGNVSTISISFTLNPPPLKPKNLSVVIEQDNNAVLKWESPGSGMVLYKVYKNNIYIGPAQVSDLSFRDTSYCSGRACSASVSSACVYEVSAIDSKGREGEKARAEILPIFLGLSGYGTYLASDSKEALNRGFFDSIRFNVTNKSTQTLTIGPLVAVGLPSHTVAAELALPVAGDVNRLVEVSALSSSEISIPVYVSTALANTISVKGVLTLPRACDAAVSISKTFLLNVRNPVEPVIELFPEALVRGTYSKVRLKFNNRGSAPLDIVTARLFGSKQIPSKSLTVELKAQSGLVLSRAELTQTAGTSIALVSNEQIYFIRIPGGGSFIFEPVMPAVPQETPEKLILYGIIGELAYSIPSGAVYASVVWTSSKTMATELAVPYKVLLYSDKQVYDKESPVQLYGQFQDIWGNLLAGFPLSLTVTNKGYERRFDVVTDSSANFSVQFTPGPTEAGIFNVSAKHPDFVGDAAFSSFSVVGMEFGWKEYTLTMAKNSSYGFEVDFTNTGETALNNVNISTELISGTNVAAGLPSRDTTTGLALPSDIPAGMKYKLPVTISAETNASDTAEFILKITESNGFERTMPLHIKTVPAQVIPKATPQMFEIGMLAGEIRTQLIMVENIGFSTWTNVQVSTPTLDWVKISGLQNNLGDIGPSKNASFTLIFEPPAGLANASYAQNPLVEIIGGGATVPINVGVTITSSRKGSVFFNVASADIPSTNPTGRLGGADLRLTSIDISGLIFTAKTDSNGLARFEDIPSGRYMYRVEAQGFNPSADIITIEPGLVKNINIFMPTTMVTYKWSVTPTLITDKYDITLDMTFRTDVPAPVIIIDPPVINLRMVEGQTAYAQYTIKNKGLISAFDIKIVPTGDDAMKIETGLQKIDELKSNQSIVVPLKITLEHASNHSGRVDNSGYYNAICGSSAPAGGTLTVSLGETAPAGQEFPPPPAEKCCCCGGTPPPTYTAIPMGGGVAAKKQCGVAIPSGPGYPRGYPNPCGPGADPASGSFWEKIWNLLLGRGSLGIEYSLDYNSLFGGINDITSANLKPLSDGSFILTLEDGTQILFVPNGVINLELALSGAQFKGVPGSSLGLKLIDSETYETKEKDGTITKFKYFPDKNYPTDKLLGTYKPVLKRDRNSTTITYEYTSIYSDAKLVKMTDVHGRNLNLNYNASGKVLNITDFTNRTASFEYDGNGNLTKATDLDSSQTNYVYDAQNRMTAITYPNGGTKGIAYDGKNRVLSITEDSGNNAQNFEYIDASSKTIVTDALGRQTAYEYINVEGRKEITKITAADGSVTKFGYDEDLNRISMTDALNRNTAMTYDAIGNMLTATDPAGNLTQMSYEQTYNQPTSIIDPKGHTTNMRYDLRGNLMEIKDAVGNITQMSYDGQGHVAGTKDPLGNISNFEYDSNGALVKVKDPLGRITLMTRDNLSRVTQTKDPANKLTLFDYDVLGNLTQVTDAMNGLAKYSYTNGGCAACGGGDLLGSVTDAKNQTTSFSYDLQRRLTSVTNPVAAKRSFAYDTKSNLTSVTDAKGQTITFTYDNMDRLITKTLPEGTVNYTYDAVGNLTVAVGLLSDTISFSYDLLNRVIESKQTIGGIIYTINYTYDANGNKTSMTTPWGNYNYSYDALNRLVSLTNSDGKTVTFTYDALGHRTKMSLPNGTETTYVYDFASQLTQVVHRKTADSTAIAFANYTYDPAGNRTSMQNTNGVHSYSYDDLHRLVSAQHPVVADLSAESFSYDSVGNRLTDANITGYNYDSANRLLSNSSYTYTHDANGNLTVAVGLLSDTINYSYNSENQLISVTMPDSTVVNFKYDALGRRIEKAVTLPSTLTPIPYRYLYDNEDIVAILDKDNNVVNIFTHGPGIDEPLIMKSSTNVNYFYHADGLGSIVALTDSAGEIVETVEYQAYGKPIIKDRTGAVFDRSTVGNFYLFTAREYDFETGLFYYRARYYDSETGRFLQEDSFFMPNGKSRYIYVDAHPTMATDSNGLLADTLLDIYFISDDLKDIYHRLVCEEGGLFLAFAVLAGDMFGAVVPGLTGVGKGIKTVEELIDIMMRWLGPGAKVFKNKAGDLVMISKDNLRKIHFDLKHPYPHKNPHFQIEEIINGRLEKTRVWPKGVEPK
ncbi:MAG: fibronectin type III domain-containing protein [Elusimicrobia bacterium]|nr:fibronectin type III domain-containing protein [Elusimicrobiota bacterium]